MKPIPIYEVMKIDMKNKLTDLNDHLFAQLERLSDEAMNKEKLCDEIARSQAITIIAREIINGGRLAIDARSKLANSIDTLPSITLLGLDR